MASKEIALLYRRVLRLHQKLPAEFRRVGDSYAKQEFRLHYQAQPKFQIPFIQEWENYANNLESGSLGEEKLDTGAFSEDQQHMLRKLKNEIDSSFHTNQ